MQPYYIREVEEKKQTVYEVVYFEKVMATAYDFRSATFFVERFNKFMEKKTKLKHWDFWDWRHYGIKRKNQAFR